MYKQPRELLETPSGTISSQAPQGCGEGSTTRARSPDRTVKPHECAATKVCSSCKQEKPKKKFSAGRSQCKPCRVEKERQRLQSESARSKRDAKNKEYYLANREELIRLESERYYANRTKRLRKVRAYQSKPSVNLARLAYNAERYMQKRDVIRAQQKRYFEANPEVFTVKAAKRRAALIQATPKWADDAAILAAYVEAERMTRTTGVKHVVDHEVPLQGKNVCGLHVACNLRVITQAANWRKSNKHTG